LSAPFHYYITGLVELSLGVAKECIAQLLWILRADNRTSAVKPQLKLSKRAPWIVSVFYPNFSI
jgi:hypothetical protein